MSSLRLFQITSRKILGCIACVSLSLLLTSCAVSTRTQYEDNDGYLPESFFKSIKKNRSLKEVVVNNLGEPVERLRTDNGDEIYTYAFTKARYKHHSVFFIARYNTVERDERFFHVVFNNGRVKKHWWNNLAEVSPKEEVVSRWPNEAGTDYSLRVIKNADPDKTNFVLTRTINPMGLRTSVESEDIPAVTTDTENSNTSYVYGHMENKSMEEQKNVAQSIKEKNTMSSQNTRSMAPEHQKSSADDRVMKAMDNAESSADVPIVDAVPSDGLFPDGKPSSP